MWISAEMNTILVEPIGISTYGLSVFIIVVLVS